MLLGTFLLSVLHFKLLICLIPCIVCMAFVTLLERKLLSLVGIRLGPYKISFLGILQPMADGIKLSGKQSNSLYNFSSFFYYVSSLLMFFFSMLLFVSLYFEPIIWVFKFSLIFVLLILGFNTLNLILCGWSSFSKFSLLGSLRSVCQLISYEAILYLCIFFFFFLYFSFCLYNFNFLSLSYIGFILPFCFLLWLPCILAEMNRSPFDFSEGESELVSGFNTEFASEAFTLIFLAEYLIIVFFSVFSVFLFFNNFIFFFLFLFFVIWIRSVLPRFRFDKLMYLCWKIFVPLMTLYFFFFIVFLL